MRTPLRLGLFALGLVAVFAVSFGVGRVAGPTASAEESHGMGSEQGDPAPGGHGSVELPGGLQIAQDGYRLFLGLQHRGEVRTAAFTVVTAPATTSSGGHG